MNKQLQEIASKIDALSFRERLMILITLFVLICFIWWNFSAVSTLSKTRQLKQQNNTLLNEIESLENTAAVIQKRIKNGVHVAKQQKLELLILEFEKVSDALDQKTQALIEPDEMFELMQQLIFAESKLKLTSMKRKQVKPVFEPDKDEAEEQQPKIYRHVLQVNFEGRYQNILEYIQKMEALEWKLIWDRITLKTAEYPIIKVNIEISTLSDNKNWVGL